MGDPIFRMYYCRRLTLPDSLQWGEPWQLWAVNHDGQWGMRMYADYGEAWGKLTKIYKDPDRFRDVTLVSRRVLHAPPPKLVWNAARYPWCSRCRRPSEFRERSPQHHALRLQPVLTDDEPRRCYYCGMRKIAMPVYYPGGK